MLEPFRLNDPENVVGVVDRLPPRRRPLPLLLGVFGPVTRRVCRQRVRPAPEYSVDELPDAVPFPGLVGLSLLSHSSDQKNFQRNKIFGVF